MLGLGYDWRLGVLVLAVLLAAGAALLLARRRGRHPRASAARAGAFAVALDDTLDALRREGDPRRAVIAAYAMMERVLAHQGALPRRPAEAPFEYLARILTERNVSRAAVARLTELFERAKFSQHEIAQDMRDEAIDALQVIRSELARPADGHVGG